MLAVEKNAGKSRAAASLVNCLMRASNRQFGFYANGVVLHSPGSPWHAAHPGTSHIASPNPQRAVGVLPSTSSADHQHNAKEKRCQAKPIEFLAFVEKTNSPFFSF